MALRIVIGIVLVVLFITVLYFGSGAQAMFLTFAAVVAVYELQRAFHARKLRPWVVPAYVCAALFPAWQYFLPDLSADFLWVACVFALLIERVCNKKRNMEETMTGMILFVYPLPFFAVLQQLGLRFGAIPGITALVLAVACPLVGDTFAYFIGTFFGSHKLCPHISPKKTIEGGVASVAGSMAASAIIYFIQPMWGGIFPMLPVLLLGLFCGLLGQAGDLFASTIKRWAGIKDFGSIFPGHGGILDRLDSVLFCAPVVYLFFYFIK